jgi:hypothetical protein
MSSNTNDKGNTSLYDHLDVRHDFNPDTQAHLSLASGRW